MLPSSDAVRMCSVPRQQHHVHVRMPKAKRLPELPNGCDYEFQNAQCSMATALL